MKIKYQAHYPEGLEKGDYLDSLLERYRARYPCFTKEQLRIPIELIVSNIGTLVSDPAFVGCDDIDVNLTNIEDIRRLAEKGVAERGRPLGSTGLLQYIEGDETLLSRLHGGFSSKKRAQKYKEAVSTIAKEVTKEVCDATKEYIITAYNTIENAREPQAEGGTSAQAQVGSFTRMVTRSQSHKRRRVHFQEESESLTR